MSERDTFIESHILTSHKVTSPSVTLQVPASTPPSDDNQASVIPKDIQTPLPLPTKSEPESSLGVETWAGCLWQRAYGWHQRHGLCADNSLEGKSTEQLVQYMMEERGFKEAAARVAVSVYPARVLAKLNRETPNGMPTVGQLRAVSDEEWEEKSRRQAQFRMVS